MRKHLLFAVACLVVMASMAYFFFWVLEVTPTP